MPQKDLHPLAKYLFRTIGGASLVLGAAAIMIGISFWWCAAFLCLGLVILAIDPWIEPNLADFLVARLLISSFFAAVLALVFALRLYFSPPNFITEPTSYEGMYKKGDMIYGIKWDEDMSELELSLSNFSGRDYENLDIVVSLPEDTKQFRGFGTIRSYPRVDIEPTTREKPFHIEKKNEQGTLVGEENIRMSGLPEVRIFCDRLPKGAQIRNCVCGIRIQARSL